MTSRSSSTTMSEPRFFVQPRFSVGDYALVVSGTRVLDEWGNEVRSAPEGDHHHHLKVGSLVVIHEVEPNGPNDHLYLVKPVDPNAWTDYGRTMGWGAEHHDANYLFGQHLIRTPVSSRMSWDAVEQFLALEVPHD